jgi:tetratricopeptide (TPR) repeat protein
MSESEVVLPETGSVAQDAAPSPASAAAAASKSNAAKAFESCLGYKKLGDDHMAKQEYSKAAFQYLLVRMNLRNYMTQFKQASPMPFMQQEKMPDGEEAELIKTLFVNSMNNLTQAQIKMGKFDKAREWSTEVLLVDPNNVKALFRRGSAYIGQRDAPEARKDLVRCLELSPGNAEVMAKLQEADQVEATMNAREKQKFKNCLSALSSD